MLSALVCFFFKIVIFFKWTDFNQTDSSSFFNWFLVRLLSLRKQDMYNMIIVIKTVITWHERKGCTPSHSRQWLTDARLYFLTSCGRSQENLVALEWGQSWELHPPFLLPEGAVLWGLLGRQVALDLSSVFCSMLLSVLSVSPVACPWVHFKE